MRDACILLSVLLHPELGCVRHSPEVTALGEPGPAPPSGPESLPVVVLVRDAADREGNVVATLNVAGDYLPSPVLVARLTSTTETPNGTYPVEPDLGFGGVCSVVNGAVLVGYAPALVREPLDMVATCAANGEVFVRFRLVGPREEAP